MFEREMEGRGAKNLKLWGEMKNKKKRKEKKKKVQRVPTKQKV